MVQKEEAIALVHEAITSGIFNDLGSGGNVDVTVITKEGVDYKRTYDAPNPRKYRRPEPYVFAPGTTRKLLSFLCNCIANVLPAILSEKTVPLSARIIVTDDTGAADAMDL